MKLSIIIPVYNVENYVEKCLYSVINQDEKDIEIICINDGSTDNSGLICDEIAKKDKRIQVYHIKNSGPAVARNMGLKKAKGDYIGFVDPDDWIDSEIYSKMLSEALKEDLDICICGFFKNTETKEILQENSQTPDEGVFDQSKLLLYAFKRFVYKGVGGYIWNKIFSRNLITDQLTGEILLFDEKLHVGEDVLWFAKAALRSKRNMYINTPYYHYFQREDSLCHMGSIKVRSGSLYVYENLRILFESAGLDKEIVLWIKRFFVYISSLLAEKAYYEDDYESLYIMQENMKKYKDEYMETCMDHEDWKQRIENLINNPEQAIRNNWNKIDYNRRTEYAKNLSEAINENYILYESFYGRGMICGPYGIFKSFMERQDFNNYIHVWSINSQEEIERLQLEYSKYKNIVFVLRKTLEYTKYLATSKYLINNVNFFYFFVKRPEQIYVNTWHGIPMKKLGYHVPDGIYAQHNSFRNFFQSDYILSWNGFMTDVYKEAYMLEGYSKSTIVEEGSPRNDLIFKTKKEYVIENLKLAGINIQEDKKIIIFAPTWKGTNTGRPDFDVEGTVKFLEYIESNIDGEEYQVFIKLHHLVHTSLVKENIKMEKAIPAFFDTSEIQVISDILITDYSSIYFDFLVTGKPVLFYITDIEDYKNYRGLYLDTTNLPGPVAESKEELTGFINNIEEIKTKYQTIYEETKIWACSKDDGKVCERVIDIFLNGNKDKYKTFWQGEKKQDRLLVFAGSMYFPEESERILSTLNKIDLEKFDVTLLFYEPKTIATREHIKKIKPGIRGLGRVHALTATIDEHRLFAEYEKGNIDFVNELSILFKREFTKNFGFVEFDYSLNLAENDKYIECLEKVMEGTKKICFKEDLSC